MQGNGALLIEVETGDTVTVRNLEGGQPCELLAWDESGASDAGVLNEKSNSNGAGLKALLTEGDDSLAALRRGLERRQLQLDKAQAVRVFGGTTPAGTEQSFAIVRDGTLVVAAPGGPMLVDGHNTATPLGVFVRRAKIRPARRGAAWPIRWPIRCSTCASIRRPPKPISSRPATISRSSMSTAASAPTSSAFRRASWTRAATIRST